jgi:phage baseplate assembly protein W
VDGRGRTRASESNDHVRDLIEQVLFTTPGERVMRSDFGGGLLSLVFEAGGPEAAATAQFLVQGSLERELSDVIALESVEVEAVDSALIVTVAYVVRGTRDRVSAEFRTPTGAS